MTQSRLLSFNKLILLSTLILLVGCSPEEKNKNSNSMASLGESVYEKNCIGCHGPNGQGLAEDWKVKDANGNYPPPPLNGTAHTWHHSPEQLLYTINKGGTEMGGQMPAFEKRLSKEEKQALIDYMYNLWPKEIQTRYDQKFK